MSFTLAIVGRPNVGKSTLFNRLVGKRLALVDDQPGVTRDLREGEARLGDLRFTVIDTAGLEEVSDESLQGRMRKLTERAVDMADICLFLIDARTGVTPTDEVFADILRKRADHVILAANKAEGAAARPASTRPTGWGWASRCACRPSMARGCRALRAAPCRWPMLRGRAEAAAPGTDVPVTRPARDRPRPSPPDARDRPMQVAVVGRPNAGKSTLINRIWARSGC